MKITYKKRVETKPGWTELSATFDKNLYNACNKAIFLEDYSYEITARQIFEQYTEVFKIKFGNSEYTTVYER